jgi:AAA family ATP:ADP antiporter
MVTAPGSGAEVIPFIKTYVNLPTAIVSTNFWLLFVVLNHSSVGRINLALIFFFCLCRLLFLFIF